MSNSHAAMKPNLLCGTLSDEEKKDKNKETYMLGEIGTDHEPAIHLASPTDFSRARASTDPLKRRFATNSRQPKPPIGDDKTIATQAVNVRASLDSLKKHRIIRTFSAEEKSTSFSRTWLRASIDSMRRLLSKKNRPSLKEVEKNCKDCPSKKREIKTEISGPIIEEILDERNLILDDVMMTSLEPLNLVRHDSLPSDTPYKLITPQWTPSSVDTARRYLVRHDAPLIGSPSYFERCEMTRLSLDSARRHLLKQELIAESKNDLSKVKPATPILFPKTTVSATSAKTYLPALKPAPPAQKVKNSDGKNIKTPFFGRNISGDSPSRHRAKENERASGTAPIATKKEDLIRSPVDSTRLKRLKKTRLQKELDITMEEPAVDCGNAATHEHKIRRVSDVGEKDVSDDPPLSPRSQLKHEELLKKVETKCTEGGLKYDFVSYTNHVFFEKRKKKQNSQRSKKKKLKKSASGSGIDYDLIRMLKEKGNGT